MKPDEELEAFPPPHEVPSWTVPAEPPHAPVEDFALPYEREEEDEVLTIRDDMIHRERIDLEAGMSPFPPATILIILACLVFFARQLMIGGLDGLQEVIDSGAMQRDAALGGEFWRLISGGFLHASPDHLIGNMIMLFILGMACEHAFGWASFLFLYTACGVTGGLLTMTGPVPTVGASGAIFGLGGAVIGLAFAHRKEIELRDRRVGLVLAIWSAYTLALGLLNPVVSNSCHLGGLLGGLLLGATLPPAILADRREHARSASTRIQLAAALAALAATSVYFLPRLF
ncbi:rhomboid family intramembrane serine protease [Planctomyces sp. SH-PL62]|uniref:rhomboid family intramembrane serine protease n=1 Tax=Planctomyces sp. SH-PL62 TaxID=1636152 RepID=UPI00078E30A9|nr:rhomboid family intramembrane serine protease [Planctomyces sp. SH-PL62]AMV39547.1 Rhomboid protease GluP [Planctomyces sp. SH-PL62]